MEKGFRFPGVNNWIFANNIYNVNSSMKSLKCSQKQKIVKVHKNLGKKNYVLKENLEHFTFSVGFTTFNVGIRDQPWELCEHFIFSSSNITILRCIMIFWVNIITLHQGQYSLFFVYLNRISEQKCLIPSTCWGSFYLYQHHQA